jgi:uncharacterized protein YqgQ
MKYYIRTTHNFNNETRLWEYRKELDNFPQIERKTLLQAHALERDSWTTAQQILNENIIYFDNFKNEEHYQESQRPTLSDVEFDLIQMEKIGLIKSKEARNEFEVGE